MSNGHWHLQRSSPIGSLLLVASDRGLSGLYTEGNGRDARIDPDSRRDPAPFREASAWLDAYFDCARAADRVRDGVLVAGDAPEAIDGAAASRVVLDLEGTPFQRRVWRELLSIPRGETISYADLARRVGRPEAFRAVGAANGRNPISIIVPCHRVVGRDGAMVGYAGGLERKAWLLAHEGCTARVARDVSRAASRGAAVAV